MTPQAPRERHHHARFRIALIATLVLAACGASAPDIQAPDNQSSTRSTQTDMTSTQKSDFEYSHGAVVRASRQRRELSLVFTGGDFSEGTTVVLDTLKRRGIQGSFFFTGGFLREPGNHDAIRRLVAEGHYLGPHSDEHLLYAPWEDREKTLVTRQQFTDDLLRNVTAIEEFGVPRAGIRWWIPPYEWYNAEISTWAREAGHPLFNFTPGTLSHTDYTEDDAKNFRSSDTIMKSILDYEGREADGLNGFLLLTHVGAGAKRTDKFFLRLDELIGHLEQRGYTFKRIDEILKGAE